jgi:hypothetical protein
MRKPELRSEHKIRMQFFPSFFRRPPHFYYRYAVSRRISTEIFKNVHCDNNIRNRAFSHPRLEFYISCKTDFLQNYCLHLDSDSQSRKRPHSRLETRPLLDAMENGRMLWEIVCWMGSARRSALAGRRGTHHDKNNFFATDTYGMKSGHTIYSNLR